MQGDWAVTVRGNGSIMPREGSFRKSFGTGPRNTTPNGGRSLTVSASTRRIRVVKAFEAYGFIWGGKRMFFDTMHFEYRPGILIFSKFPIRTW
jgi:hypothetical protein